MSNVTIWEFIGVTIDNAITMMQETDFFYGISLWNFVELFLVLSALGFLTRSLFKSKKGAKDLGDKE